MRWARLSGILCAAVSVGLLGCASLSGGKRTRVARVIELPLVAVQSDIEFALNTEVRQKFSCALDVECAAQAETTTAQSPVTSPLNSFVRQVRYVGDALQAGAEKLYPDLAQRLPREANGQFAFLVVEDDEPGSTSSASGRIAINAVLASRRPSEGFLVFAVAREMGHVLARHHVENSSLSAMASALLNAVLPSSGWFKTLASTGGAALAANSNRQVQKAEADTIARELIAASGYRLGDVAHGLSADAALLDNGAWSKEFGASAAAFVAEAMPARTASGKFQGAMTRATPRGS